MPRTEQIDQPPESSPFPLHTVPGYEVLASLRSSPHGLSRSEAAARLERFGRNILPRPSPPGIGIIFLRQFLSPLIYILLLAAIVSLLLQEWSDAVFISAVLLINAVIGAVQEYSAERNAEALRNPVTTQAHILCEGDLFEVNAEELVPGDIVLLMVLFENVHVFNCRAELQSAFTHNPVRNPLLLFGTLAAQLIHIGATYTPWLRDVLRIRPVAFAPWVELLGLALVILAMMEIYKAVRRGKAFPLFPRT